MFTRSSSAVIESDDSVYLKRLREAAAAARLVLVFGFAERAGETIYNCAGSIGADGPAASWRRWAIT